MKNRRKNPEREETCASAWTTNISEHRKLYDDKPLVALYAQLPRRRHP